MIEWTRDFRGYEGRPPPAEWPDGARVALSLVINFEEGAELAIADGDERNEHVYEAIEEVRGSIDPCMMTHYEYATRSGYWRIMELLEQYGIRATLSACGRAVERSPWIAKDAILRGHEVSCHGYRWESHAGKSKTAVYDDIKRTVLAIQNATGVTPVGWHTRSAAAAYTRRALVEHGGFLYDSDAYNDDLPYLVAVGAQPHVVVPYSFDTNDMRFQPGGGFVHARDFTTYCADAFDCLWREGARIPKMMSVGLHLRIIGRPGRIEGLESFLEHVRRKGGAWLCRRDEIAMHWRKLNGLAPAARSPHAKPSTKAEPAAELAPGLEGR